MQGYFLKRVIDITVSLMLLFIGFPFMLLAMLLVLLDGHTSPFFMQRRVGLHCKEFTIYKFRTMRAPLPLTAGAPTTVKPEMPHLTPIARFMRKSGLDELPQLFNILRGDMSLVGPRPHAVEFFNHYVAMDPRFIRRQCVRPGLACITEVTRAHYFTEQLNHIRIRTSCDLYYINHMSLLLDLKIFYKIFLHMAKPFAQLALDAVHRMRAHSAIVAKAPVYSMEKVLPEKRPQHKSAAA